MTWAWRVALLLAVLALVGVGYGLLGEQHYRDCLNAQIASAREQNLANRSSAQFFPPPPVQATGVGCHHSPF